MSEQEYKELARRIEATIGPELLAMMRKNTRRTELHCNLWGHQWKDIGYGDQCMACGKFYADILATYNA